VRKCLKTKEKIKAAGEVTRKYRWPVVATRPVCGHACVVGIGVRESVLEFESKQTRELTPQRNIQTDSDAVPVSSTMSIRDASP
jgi:hypothetical protein